MHSSHASSHHVTRAHWQQPLSSPGWCGVIPVYAMASLYVAKWLNSGQKGRELFFRNCSAYDTLYDLRPTLPTRGPG
jgi:hypothetical protein